MAIAHDDDWCFLVRPVSIGIYVSTNIFSNLFFQDDQVLPDKDELVARLIANFDLKMDPASGESVFLFVNAPSNRFFHRRGIY